MPSHIVLISVGQAGIQLSNATWELFCLEHGVGVDGEMLAAAEAIPQDRFEVFFYRADSGKTVPRSVIADLEATVVDEIRVGAYRGLFHPETMVNSYEDAANNFARGYYSQGKLILKQTMRQVRKQTEVCDNLQGYFYNIGMGGGTGSGFNSLLMKEMSDKFGKNSKVTTSVFPGPSMSTAMVEPYNVALAMKAYIEESDVSITLDNQACYNVCKNSLHFPNPTYSHVNRIMSYATSSLTSSLRFNSVLNSDLIQLQTNLVPFPRIHFPVVSYAPLLSYDAVERVRLTAMFALQEAFSPSGRLISCDIMQGKFMALNLMFRGAVSPREINEAVINVKQKHNFEWVDWCPTGVKIGLVNTPICQGPNTFLAATKMSLTKLSNTTALVTLWERLLRQFNVLHSKRAFVHWYVGEGMEEGELNEASEEIAAIVNDYREVGGKTEPEEEGEGEEGKEEDQEVEAPPMEEDEAQSRDEGQGYGYDEEKPDGEHEATSEEDDEHGAESEGKGAESTHDEDQEGKEEEEE